MSVGGRRALVTGANGFIGSHLVERLLADGFSVLALCRYDENGSWGWLDHIRPGPPELEVLLGDVRDPGFVDDATGGIDTVFHLAALVSIPHSYEAPASYISTNVTGTLNVLQAARRHGVSRVVHTSTSEVYGSPQEVPIRETHPLQGQSPYSASKIAADKLCESFALSFNVPVVTLRPFNTYGPRQSARAVIPTILGQLLTGATKVHLGDLSPRRDFTFVSDTIAGFMAIASADIPPGSVVQLGTGSSVSIGELFDLCVSITGVDATVVPDEKRVRPERSEVDHLRSDPSRAHDLLGWQPTVSLEDGLRRTADWLEGRVDPARAAEYHT